MRILNFLEEKVCSMIKGGYRMDDIHTDSKYYLDKINYKKLSRQEENKVIKKSKLSFYYSKDTTDELKNLYLKYFLEDDYKDTYFDDEILKKMIGESKKWRDKFLMNNQFLIIKRALKYANKIQSLSVMELVIEGNIGMLRALEKFDVEKGYRFSTYATMWIRQAIENAIANQDKLVRAPIHFNDSIKKVKKVRNELYESLHREPSVEEISVASGIKTDTVKDALHFDDYMWIPSSLDRVIDNDRFITVGDTLKNDEDDFTDFVNDKVDLEMINRLFLNDNFDSLMINVLKLKYGFIDDVCHSYGEISKMLNIDYYRVIYLEKQGLNIIRNQLKIGKTNIM